MNSNPNRGSCVATLLAVAMLLTTNQAFSYTAFTSMSYDDTYDNVFAYSETSFDFYDFPYDYWCWQGNSEYCERVLLYVSTAATGGVMYSPYGIYSSGYIQSGYSYAALTHSAPNPLSGQWSATGNHYVVTDTYDCEVNYDNLGGMYLGNCYYVWSDPPQLIGTSVAQAYVAPCIHHGVPTSGSISRSSSFPNDGLGYHHYLGTDLLDTDDWACFDWLQLHTSYAASAWYYSYDPNHPLGIGDMSLPGGGYWSDHASHQNGLDVDIRFIRTDGTQGQEYGILDLRAPGSEAAFDRAKTITLMNWFCADGATDIFVASVANISQSDVSCRVIDEGHYNHFHVRYYDPDGLSN